RLSSIPFVSLAEQKIVVKGVLAAYEIAQEYKLDIIHTQTEFGMGILGKLVATQLRIPVIHTFHTKYEDYVHYIAKGRLIRPAMVKYVMLNFLRGVEAIICPSEMVLETVQNYGVEIPKRVIPTGIDLSKFIREDISKQETDDLRTSLNIQKDETMILSLSRIAEEKNIQAVISALPDVLKEEKVKLVIVGDGPYADNLKDLVADLSLQDSVLFTGKVENDQTAYYYKAADFFISASTSETQGLTFLEALAAGTRVLGHTNPYLLGLINHKEFGQLFDSEDDIASTIISASQYRQPIDKALLDQKLFEISSEHFAQEVQLFYMDTLIDYQTRKKLQPTTPEKIEDSIRQLPIQMKRSIRREQLRARYFTKKAKRFTKNIQNYVKIDTDKRND
ncbi:MAG: glycosyltransferase, partial [Streptococcaceae bacterium]|nr:glycosyltransferase [Streptococcaceae bacterium]